MAGYTYLILSTGAAGRAEEFRTWYREQHVVDVARMKGVVSARLLFPTFQVADGMDVPTFAALAIYELDCEDARATIDAMFAQAGTDAMPMSDSIDMAGLFQFVGQEIVAIDNRSPAVAADAA